MAQNIEIIMRIKPNYKNDHHISSLIQNDIRHTIFRNATRFVDYEMIPGDIFEFGVYTGRSLALLAHYHELNKVSIHRLDFKRSIVGFDSFDGLPSDDGHPRWRPGLFNVNHSYHPFCKNGEKVTADTVYSLFERCRLPKPRVEVGKFERLLPKVIGKKYMNVALVHIDCDLYESTKTVLMQLHNVFQEGTVILFDDWFNFRGRKDKGEQKAFYEYQRYHRKWLFKEYQNYATFGKAFILNAKRTSHVKKF